MTGPPTRLKGLLRQRHLQNYRTFCREYDKIAREVDDSLAGTYPSRAQFYRWLSGKISGQPYPDHCLILEAMFPDYSARALFESLTAERPGRAADPGQRQLEQHSDALDNLVTKVADGFSADTLGGLWVTCYQFTSERGIRHHADITQLTPQSNRRITARNYPPDPRTEDHVPPFRNEIEAQLANRHLIGQWRNTADTRYFGSIHVAVLPGENIMEGYYTGLTNDIKVDAMHWKWVRLDPVSLSGVELSQVVLQEADTLYTLLERSTYNAPLTLTAVVEKSN